MGNIEKPETQELSGAERRAADRKLGLNQARALLVLTVGSQLSGHILDISTGGVCFTFSDLDIPVTLQLGAYVGLVVETDQTTLHCVGMVRNIIGRAGAFRVGVSFEGLAPGQAIDLADLLARLPSYSEVEQIHIV